MTATTRHGDDEGVRRSVLPSGLRIVTESLPAVRSAALSIWVGVGSRDEDLEHAGATHYLEHLLQKGTDRRTALEISAAMDAVGGDLNAFTDKECTFYYARVLDTDVPLAVDVLSDMVTNSLLAPEEVAAEREVILEEIAMYEDDHADAAHEAFEAQLFGDTPLGRPILGTVDSINSIGREQLIEHYQARYKPPHMVVAAAGNVEHMDIVEHISKAFDGVSAEDAAPSAPRVARGITALAAASGSGVRLVPRPSEQANLVLGCAGLSRTDDQRFALGVLNATLGGGMSSRLFQEIREKRGLAYAVYSFTAQYSDTGLWATYIGCLPAKVDEVLAICQEEIAKVISKGLTDAELERGKGYLRGALVLGLEDPTSRMSRIGRAELVYPRLQPVEAILASIAAVTHDDVRQVADTVLNRPQVLGVVGPFDDDSSFAAALR